MYCKFHIAQIIIIEDIDNIIKGALEVFLSVDKKLYKWSTTTKSVNEVQTLSPQ